jgi:hypothetical protein
MPIGLLKRDLHESLNFERGADPKKSMSIGITRKMKEMLSHIHMESRQAELDYFGGLGWEIGIQALKSILWTIYYDNMNPDEAFRKVWEVWKITRKESKDFLKKVLNKELGLVINESFNFERGKDPKASMEIGDAAILPPLIDSNILEAVGLLSDFTEEEYKEFRGEEDADSEEQNYQFVKRVKVFLEGKITFGKYFDWKEQDEMEEYIKKYSRGRYVYNGSPGQDGCHVIFSKIYLPRAEAIDI